MSAYGGVEICQYLRAPRSRIWHRDQKGHDADSAVTYKGVHQTAGEKRRRGRLWIHEGENHDIGADAADHLASENEICEVEEDPMEWKV